MEWLRQRLFDFRTLRHSSWKLARNLYLRPFVVDRNLLDTVHLQLAGIDLSLEQRIADHFSAFGSMRAISSGNWLISAQGIMKESISEDAWKEAASAAAEQSDFIILSPGIAPGITWEMNMLTKKGLLSKTIVVMPESRFTLAALRAISADRALNNFLSATETRFAAESTKQAIYDLRLSGVQ